MDTLNNSQSLKLVLFSKQFLFETAYFSFTFAMVLLYHSSTDTLSLSNISFSLSSQLCQFLFQIINSLCMYITVPIHNPRFLCNPLLFNSFLKVLNNGFQLIYLSILFSEISIGSILIQSTHLSHSICGCIDASVISVYSLAKSEYFCLD